ncbi:MAG: 50S ribosomal protein L24e [Candidatus Freyarchaeota archaeon]
MVRKYNCSFCGEELEIGTGIQYVRRDGSSLYFCSSKCRKNLLELNRKPRKLKWTKSYQKQ